MKAKFVNETYDKEINSAIIYLEREINSIEDLPKKGGRYLFKAKNHEDFQKIHFEFRVKNNFYST